VTISKVDTCNSYTPLLDAGGFATLADSDFEVGKTLDWATLNTTVEAYDFVSNTYFNVFVDLTWTATSDPVRSTIILHDKSPGLIFSQKMTGRSRVAETTGSVSDETTNFTPNPAPDGYISNVQTGNVTIFK
jgi:hypothetical protein